MGTPTTDNNMSPLLRMLVNMAQNNPNIKSNPNAQEMLNVIMSGDSKRGEEMANNLLQSYGVSKEEGINQAQTFFGQMLGGPPGR